MQSIGHVPIIPEDIPMAQLMPQATMPPRVDPMQGVYNSFQPMVNQTIQQMGYQIPQMPTPGPPPGVYNSFQPMVNQPAQQMGYQTVPPQSSEPCAPPLEDE